MLRLIALLVLIGSAQAEFQISTAAGDEIPVRTHPADGDALLIWLSSEFGDTPRRVALAAALAQQGIEVWAPDLHAAWFIPAGRYSLNQVDPSVIAAILDAALASGHDQLYLMAEGRSVGLALAGVRHWQHGDRDTSRLRGLLAFSPKLYLRTPQGGAAAEYLPVAAASNLPIYILQPRESGGIWRLAEHIEQLEAGGSPVLAHPLAGVSDGFHARVEFSEAEAAMTRRLPAILIEAMRQLQLYGGTPADPAPMDGAPTRPETPNGTSLLRPATEQRQAPALRLPSLDGRELDLAQFRDQVVLVNFWTSWCPPCVEEIPSLQRLYKRLQPRGLEILAVDVGESASSMRRFLADKPVSFPVLMDQDGEVLRRWGIYAFPTTLVLDRDHRIRYAVFGAFDWSSNEVIEALEPLLAD